MERRCKHTFFLYLFTITLIIICSGTQQGTAMPVQDIAIQNIASQDSSAASGLLRPDAETLKNPFWPQVEELLNSYVTEDFDAYVNISVCDHWNDIDREQEHPAKYIFPASVWKNNVEIDESDVLDHYLLIADHDYERKEYFDFYIWVEEIDGTDVLKTDFSQQLFAHILAECTYSVRMEGSSSYLIGNAPSFSKYAIPYYELLEEPLVLQASSDVSQITTIFQNAYDMMYEWQNHISGDLSQNIRFCDIFSPESEEVYITPEKPEEELSSIELTNWSDTMSIQGYQNWLDKYGQSFPEHLISFNEDYSSVQEELFATLLEERQVYRTSPAPESDSSTDSSFEAGVASDFVTNKDTVSETDTDSGFEADDKTDIIPDSDVNADFDSKADDDADIVFDSETDMNTDSTISEAETDTDSDSEVVDETDIISDSETDTNTDSDSEANDKAGFVSDSKTDADSDSEADDKTDIASDSEADMDTDFDPEVDDEQISFTSYVVSKGDTLWAIAEHFYGDGQYAYKIWNDNREIIGNNMNLILPGMQLEIAELPNLQSSRSNRECLPEESIKREL